MAYQELSTFYLERIKLAQQTTLLREHCSPKPDSSTAQRNIKLMPDQSSPSRSGTGVSDGRVSSRQKVKDKHVDLMMFWLTTSALYNCHISKRKIDALVTDLGRKELNKAVTEKAMASLPDGILMNLTDKGKSSIYAAEDTFPPLTSLCPSHQSAVKAPSITWRKVVNLLTVINKRVYPTQQDPLLTTLLSDWMNEESTVIHHILQEHLKDPYEACVPALLPRLAVDHHTRLAAKQKLDLPTIPIVIPIQSQVERWYNTNEALLYSKWLKNTENGYFTLHLAFTAKEVKHISSFAIAAQVGIQVLTAVLHKAQISHLMSEVTENIKLLSSVKDTDNKSRKTSSSLLTEDLQVTTHHSHPYSMSVFCPFYCICTHMNIYSEKQIFTGKYYTKPVKLQLSNLGWGTEVLLNWQPVIASQSSKIQTFIKEPQTAVSPLFGLISVVYIDDGEYLLIIIYRLCAINYTYIQCIHVYLNK